MDSLLILSHFMRYKIANNVTLCKPLFKAERNKLLLRLRTVLENYG